MPRPSSRAVIDIAGVRVDTALLEERRLRRCRLNECDAYCCGGGVAVSVRQARDILRHRALIAQHLPPDCRDARRWFKWRPKPDRNHPDGGLVVSTTVVDDPTHPTGSACVFLRADRKCALQAAGIAAGHHPWRFKPLYCALHPLTFERGVLGLAERNAMYRDGGRCHHPARQRVALFRLFADELRWLLARAGYARLGRISLRRAVGSRSS